MSTYTPQELEEALKHCEAEPIHQIAQIQPHGALLVLSSDKKRIVLQASDNLAEYFDLPPNGVYGQPLAKLMGETEAERIEQLILDAKDCISTGKVLIHRRQESVVMQVRVFTSGKVFIVELVREEVAGYGEQRGDLILSLQRVLMSSETDIYRYFGHIAEGVRTLTGYDRVMIYRFDTDWDGEVIAENCLKTVTSYLGSRFPASDIPPQARQLYTINWVRQIVDIDAKPVPILPTLNPATRQPLDLTHSALRSLSLVHIEYLRNMGVRASMSISLLQNGRLWGLIACHNMTTKRLSGSMQEASAIISQTISARLTLLEAQEHNKLGNESIRIIGKLLKQNVFETTSDILRNILVDLQALVSATGILVIVESKHYIHGEVPAPTKISALVSWLGSLPSTEIFDCNYLAKQFAHASEYSNIVAGLLAGPVSSNMQNCIIWFRKEKLRTVQWAGNIEKPIFKNQEGGVRLSPRTSFETWTELWRGRSASWSPAEIATAKLLVLALTEGLAQKSRLDQELAERRQAEERLRQSQQLTDAIIDNIPAMVCLKRASDLRFELFNRAGEELLGYSTGDLLGKSDYDLFPKEQADFFTNQDRKVLESQGAIHIPEETITNAKGEIRHLYTSKIALHDQTGKPSHLLGISIDITDRKKTENALRLAATTFEANEPIMITDAQAKILRVNQAFQRVTGYHSSEVIGKNPRIFKSGRHGKEFYVSMWAELLGKGTWEGEVWDRRKNGEVYPKQMTITAVKDQHGNASEYVSIFRDISEFKLAEDEIHQLAFYDPLTKLPNRRLLHERFLFSLSSSDRKKMYCAILFLDMDKFKLLNDTMGHHYGDLMLIEVADRIKSNIRGADTIARIGGDEFVVLLDDLSDKPNDASQKAALTAEKIRAALAVPYIINEYTHQSSPSIGVCLYQGHEKSVEDLLKNADIAMYEAKNKGRNQVFFFDHSLQQAVETRVTLESDLRQATPNHQLHLYYQIQMNSHNLAIGAEALIRWIHPKRGLISPLQFIPIAEESSLILDVGRWVVDTAVKQLAKWSQNDRTRNLILAINVSAHQFNSPDFVESIKSAIKTYSIDPSLLKLELTESVLLSNIDEIVGKMHALGALGVKLSIDDFGTGYSSLSYMKRLPIHQIKIDQSFMRNIESDSGNIAIVKAIIGLAKTFNCDLIAEGIETEGQLNFLKQNGCLGYQGYLFSKPVPIEEFEELLGNQSLLVES